MNKIIDRKYDDLQVRMVSILIYITVNSQMKELIQLFLDIYSLIVIIKATGGDYKF